ncbi:hypothetical protein ABT404_40490 [Streptomyces hyaluromycini]|uniref:DUF4280 domain-containing protein n=1 Tax=Streptomyces hyaluromycini TaxID=1377993 RepID=A0ABV1X9I4_9ACTN
MPGYLLHAGTTVACAHTGEVTPATGPGPGTRVKVGGFPVTVATDMYTVRHCPLPAQPGTGPCVSALWAKGASRVLAGGVPVVLSDSPSVCTPTGTPLTVQVAVQRRVRGV